LYFVSPHYYDTAIMLWHPWYKRKADYRRISRQNRADVKMCRCESKVYDIASLLVFIYYHYNDFHCTGVFSATVLNILHNNRKIIFQILYFHDIPLFYMALYNVHIYTQISNTRVFVIQVI